MQEGNRHKFEPEYVILSGIPDPEKRETLKRNISKIRGYNNPSKYEAIAAITALGDLRGCREIPQEDGTTLKSFDLTTPEGKKITITGTGDQSVGFKITKVDHTCQISYTSPLQTQEPLSEDLKPLLHEIIDTHFGRTPRRQTRSQLSRVFGRGANH